MLVVAMDPPEGVQTVAPSFKDWKALSSWFENLSAGRDGVTAGIAAEASSLAGAAGEAFWERVRAMSLYVRDTVRYVAKEVGIDGYQPRAAAETHASLYGDCKDVGTLLRSMLSTQQIEAYPVLINASRHGTVSEEIPALMAFNHFIVAVPVPGDVELDEAAYPALAEYDGWGRLMFVDTTDEYTSVGWIASHLAGKRALIVDGDRSELVTLPGRDAQDHRIERTLKTDVTDEGVRLERVTRYYGAPAFSRRYEQRLSSEDRRKEIEASIRRLWVDAHDLEYEVEPETEDGAFAETIRWSSPKLLLAGERTVLPLFHEADRMMPMVSLSRRKSAVRYEHPLSIDYRTVVSGVDEEIEIPTGKSSEASGFQLATEFERDGDTVRAGCKMSLSRTQFEPEEFRDLRRIFSRAKKAGEATLWFD